jgi:PhnB protein
MPLAEMFWGGFFGHLDDPVGMHWMFNCASKT